MIEDDNPSDWVDFKFAIADKTSSQNKMKQYIALSLLLGGIIGAMYVLISSAIHKRRDNLVKS